MPEIQAVLLDSGLVLYVFLDEKREEVLVLQQQLCQFDVVTAGRDAYMLDEGGQIDVTCDIGGLGLKDWSIVLEL